MTKVQIPLSSTINYISGLASKNNEKQVLKLGQHLKSGEYINIPSNALIEFIGDDGTLYVFNNNTLESLTNLLEDSSQSNIDRDKVQEIIEAIEQGLDTTQDDENATAAGTFLKSSGTHGFYVLARSGSETIASAGYHTKAHIASESLMDSNNQDDFSSGFTLDTAAPGTGTGGADERPTITLPEAADGVSHDEARDGVDALVTPPTGTAPGDTVTVTLTKPDGSTTDISTAVPAGWTDGTPVTVTIPTSDIGDGTNLTDGDYTLTATVSDTAGNTSLPSDAAGFTLDTAAPGTGTGTGGADERPTITLPEAADGVSHDEARDGVDALVTPPTGTAPGDTVTVTLTKPDGSTTDISTAVPAGWTDGTPVTVTIPTSDIGDGTNLTDGDYTLTATVSDTAGNTSLPSDAAGFTLDTAAPGTGTGGADERPTITLPEAADGVSHDEARDGVDALVTPPTGTAPGDTVTVTLTKPDGSTTDISTAVPAGWTDGTPVTVTIPTSDIGDGTNLTDGDYTLTATVSDTAGNTSLPSDAAGFTLDTAAPGTGTGTGGADERPTITLPEAADGVSHDEARDGVDALVTPPTGTAPGDTVTVTLTKPDGSTTDISTAVPAGWTDGTPVTVTIPTSDIGDGTNLTDGDYTLTATVSDTAGNTSLPSDAAGFTLDTAAPGTGTGGADERPTITLPEAADGVSHDEARDGVDALVTPPTGTAPGDTVTVTLTKPDGSTTDISTAVPAGWTDGTPVTVTIPTSDIGDGTNLTDGDYTLTATVSDTAGNTSLPSDAAGFTLDTAAPGTGTGTGGADERPTITLPEAADGVSHDEARDGVDALVTPPTGTAPGDTVTVTLTKPDGSTTDISTAVPAGWTDGTPVTVTIPTSDIGDGTNLTDGDYTLTATVSDTAGNTSLPSDAAGFTLDTAAPGTGTGTGGADERPTITLPEAADGVSHDEARDGVDALVTPPTGTAPGDTVTVTLTKPDGSTTDISTAVPAGWTDGTPVTVTIPTSDIGDGTNLTDGDYTLTATVSDTAGNTSLPSDAAGFTLDTAAPGTGTGTGGADERPTITLPEAADGVSHDEARDGVDALVTPPTGTAPGDTVTVTLTKPDGSTTDISTAVPAGWTDGTPVTVTIPTSDIGDGTNLTDGDYTLTATVSDTAGNTSLPSDAAGFTLDTAAPGTGTGGADERPTITLPEAADGVSHDEARDGVDALVTPPTGTAPGDTVTVTLTKPDGSTTDISTAVPAGWTDGTPVTVTIPTSDIGDGTNLTDGDYTLTATVSDTAGNTSLPSDAAGFTLDTAAPGTGTGGADERPTITLPEAADGVSHDEARDGVDALVTPPTGTAPGDTVTVTLTKPDGSTTDISTAVPAGWTDGTPVTVTIPTSDIGDGTNLTDGDYTLTATVSDTAGNTSLPSDAAGFTLDTETKVESITWREDATEGNRVSWDLNMTNTSTTDTTIEVKFSDGVHQADFGSDYNGKIQVYTKDGTFLEEIDITGHKGAITVPAGQDGVIIYADTLNDEVYEGDESFTIMAGATHQDWVQSDTVTITDEADLPEVASITWREDATEGNRVSWDLNMTNTSTTDTTIEVKFSDGAHQADFGSDYNGKIQVYTKDGTFLEEIDITGYKGAITVPAGQDGVIIYADTLNDDVYEGNESFTIMAGATHQDWVQSDTATITDEADLPEVDSVTRVQDAIEGGLWAAWTVNMTHTSTTDSIVELSFDDSLHQAGILNHGDDYVGQVNVHALDGTFLETVYMNIDNVYRTEITVPAGHAGVEIRAATLDDSVYEGNETLIIKAGAPHQAWVVSEAAVIIDDADLPEVDSITLREDATEGNWVSWDLNMTNTSTTDTTIEVKFSDGAHQADFGSDYNGKIQVYTKDGTFLEEIDITGYKGAITVPAGQDGVIIYADTLNDDVYEGNESFTIMAGATHQDWVQSDTATITDEADLPEVDSVTRVQDAIEGGLWAAWTVNMTHTSTTDSIVELSFDDSLHQAGILNHGDDYVGQVNVHALDGTFLETVYMNIDNVYRTEITVPAGHEGVQLRAATMQDSVYEGNETLVIKAGAPHQAWVTSDAVVIIDDADLPEVDSVTRVRDAIEGDQWAAWTVNMTNTSTTDSIVELSFDDSLHQAGILNHGDDYVGQVNVHALDGTFLETVYMNIDNAYRTEITVPAGHAGVEIRAATLDDSVYEGNETLIIKAGAPHQAWVVSEAAVIIDDADLPEVDSITLREDATEGNWVSWDLNMTNTSTTDTTIEVKFSDGAHQADFGSDYNGKIQVYTKGGTFLEEIDITGYKGAITVPAGQDGVIIYADTLNDDVYEGNESFTIMAGATHQDWVQSDTATITDEADLPEVDSVTRVQDAIEGGQWAAWTVNMTHTSTTDSIVELSFDDSLHQAGILNHGDDYVGQVNVHALDGTFLETVYMNIDNVYRTEITVPAGHAGVEIRAATLDDSVYEGNETLIIKAGAPHQAWVVSEAAVIIDDADLKRMGRSLTFTTEEEETNLVGLVEEHSISGLDNSELVWHSEDVASQPWSDTVTDFTIGEPPLDLSDLVTDGDDNLLSEDDVDMYEQDGSTVLRVDTNGDHVWNQEIILQDVSLDDIVDENGIIKNGVFGDNNVKALFQKAASVDAIDSSTSHLDDPRIDDQ
ncbi:retention module-containing protein [Enterovibrio norvegicus]|uniref:retention module-containing protein n=1 Tax=Enterovibrio norvegicus TaxID=188144 RepID=UPI0024B12CE2|nr:retention module-containing protein [Enterovibrio norvegicus]